MCSLSRPHRRPAGGRPDRPPPPAGRVGGGGSGGGGGGGLSVPRARPRACGHSRRHGGSTRLSSLIDRKREDSKVTQRKRTHTRGQLYLPIRFEQRDSLCSKQGKWKRGGSRWSSQTLSLILSPLLSSLHFFFSLKLTSVSFLSNLKLRAQTARERRSQTRGSTLAASVGPVGAKGRA